MDKHGLCRDTIRTFLSPVTGGGYGLGPDVLSGYCTYAPETQHPLDGDEQAGGQMFPGGNAGFARHIVKTLIPDSIEGPRTLEGVCRGRRRGRRRTRRGRRERKWATGNSCERSGIHSRGASGGSGGCAASTPQLNEARSVLRGGLPARPADRRNHLRSGAPGFSHRSSHA